MRLRAWFRGRKTIWVARAYVLAGMLLSLEGPIQGNLPSVQYYLPWKYWPLALMGTGILFECLRWVTDGPPHPYNRTDDGSDPSYMHRGGHE
jgi:hypothetical protein